MTRGLFTTIFIVGWLFAAGCQPLSVTDPVTTPELKTIDKPDGAIVYHHRYDNMDRGKHELSDQLVVVDPNHYQTNAFARGDIILLEGANLTDRFTHTLSRIVGLPGETIRIDKGQVYIDGRRLDTFYGKAHRAGLNAASYRSRVSSSTPNADVNGMLEILESSMDEVAISADHVFVIGDDWFRSNDSRMFGPIPRSAVKGKVLGMCTNCEADLR